MSAAANGDILGVFWLLAAKVSGQQQESTPLSCSFQCLPTGASRSSFLGTGPSSPLLSLQLPGGSISWDTSGAPRPFPAFWGACLRVWAAVPRGLFPWLLSL